MQFIYPAIIHQENDGFWAEFPDLEGTFTQGDSLNEIMTNATEAMELTVLELLENSKSLPKATEVNSVRHDKQSFVTLIQSDIDLAKNSKSIKKTLTIPAWLNDKALAKGINFSKVLQEALIAKTL
ncbi:MAG: type II toxin-antitoxin system HicB family antitoxin [Veillonellaceae bacterium]|nr:type II toxin-antitoxin system HicB family antitoxin [Veillonellaceae bacterium]